MSPWGAGPDSRHRQDSACSLGAHRRHLSSLSLTLGSCSSTDGQEM